MSGWHKINDSPTVFVFVHGLLSNSAKCWTSDSGIFWPDLIAEDPRFKSPSIFLAEYHTSILSNDYGVHNCADEVFEQLKREDSSRNIPPINKDNIVFVTHSAGGIVTRYLLASYSDYFCEKNIGLCLYASPSFGSKWSSWLRPIAGIFNHKLAKELSWGSPLLENLDERFKQLLDTKKLSIVGMEACENMAPLRIPFIKNRFVEKASAYRYFPRIILIASSDHSSIVKPITRECQSHQVLLDFVIDKSLLKTQSEIQNRVSSNEESLPSDVFHLSSFSAELVDKKIEEEMDLLRKTRFFEECDRPTQVFKLAKRLVEGDLSGGANAARGRGLAWCARLLSPNEELEKAEECLKLANTLTTCPEIEIAKAFIFSKKGDKNAALNILAGINSPMSRTAGFMVVSNHDGSQAAIDWLKTSGINTTDLDPDGKYYLLEKQINLSQWEAARKTLEVLSNDDLNEAPALHHLIAMTHLLSVVPAELCSYVLTEIPFNAESFPLASDADSINVRRVAKACFIKAAKVVRQLNLIRSADKLEEYALWLELKDPDESEKGREKLEARLRNPESALRLVHLALQFGIELDLEIVKQEIERQKSLHGEITHDAAIARFSLAFIKETPEGTANYIEKHFKELSKYINKKVMRFAQIEMLAKAGLQGKAQEFLNILVEEGITEAEENRCKEIISRAEGTDPIEAQKELFKQTDSLADLGALVIELESKEKWDSLCEYGEIIFERTKSLQDAERFANALSNTQKTEQLVKFIKANASLMEQSQSLRMLFCWSLFDEGAFLEARTELANLNNDQGIQNYRALQINLGIALGDWNSLSAIVANDCAEKDNRSAQELLGAAQLSLCLGSHHAKELIFAAAAKGSDDAEVLASAYFYASSADWEDDEEVSKWIQKAAELSGDDGPVQMMTFRDFLDRKPEWDRRESETWKLLSQGKIPVFLAAKSLNKSLVQLMLFPAFANLTENDLRKKGCIPTFSGKRQLTPLKVGGSIGLDATALLTLSYLNLLEKALDVFDTVYLPHSTLAWLFEERKKASFHQPSRIRNAHKIQSLLATDVLMKFEASTVPDSVLSDQIGDELALLIAEAEKVRDNDDLQRIVVRPSPVHRVASLIDEEADLTAHADVLSNCQSIVDKLRQKGQITAEEEKKAKAYLQIQEKPWPNQPEISDGAILYLDDLAVTYFLQLGILEKLKTAGFKPIVSPRKVSETNELISYESISDQVIGAIEHIRTVTNSRIESGKIRLGRRPNMKGTEEQSIFTHPTGDIFTLAKNCDVVISDDRCINQHTNIDIGSELQTPIFTTLDFIDGLEFNGSITVEDRLEFRTKLRKAGYIFVPVSNKELEFHLDACQIQEDKLIETAELKAIRESILKVRMSSYLQLPQEAPWLNTVFQVFNQVLKGLWKADADFSSVRVRSNWLIDQLDMCGWAHSFGGAIGDNLVNTERGVQIISVLLPLVSAPPDVKEKYFSWVEDKVLARIKEQHPDLYSSIIDRVRILIANMADKDISEGGAM